MILTTPKDQCSAAGGPEATIGQNKASASFTGVFLLLETGFGTC